MSFRHVSLVFGLAFSFSTAAFADGGEEGDFEISPFGGYSFLDNYGAVNPENGILYGLRVGYFIKPTASFEISYQRIHSESNFPAALAIADVDGTIGALNFNLLWNLLPGRRVRPFGTLGLGWRQVDFGNVLETHDLGVNVGTGLRYLFTDRIGARVEGRYVASEVSGPVSSYQHDFEVAGGVTFLFGGGPPKDSDGDGVIDRKDKCSGTPSGATVDEKGCPVDSDGDGVADGLDKCADTPKGSEVDASGCLPDADGDKVSDTQDQCPDTAAGVAVDDKGCPQDKDNDGVGDPIDKCPDTAVGVKVDGTGCPADSDADGVKDDIDQCADTPADSQVDEKGCPKESVARGVLKGVTFKTGSAVLTPESSQVMVEIAEQLKQFPKVKVEIQGHTDSTGNPKTNMTLSKARAQAVLNDLVSKGVERERLVANGYGASKPIADNATSAGRKANRRVELIWKD